jgi:hypothetical protein
VSDGLPRIRLVGGRASVSFQCPGCGDHHTVPVSVGAGRDWTWDGKVDRPTLTPSILVKSGHHGSSYVKGDPCWCTFNAENPGQSSFTCYLCHSHVTDGKIAFLTDCTHALAGQTVDLPVVRNP